jgi:galactokinase
MTEAQDQVLARAKAEFTRRFGSEPAFAAAAPGRVNLIGEHTDYTGGLVLPVAIDRVCVAVGGPAAEPARSRVVAADLGEDASIDWRGPITMGESDRPGEWRRGSWLSYVAGVAAEFREAMSPRALSNLDVVIASSVPVGSGLSSSAAIEVATATLLEAAVGVTLGPRDKALLCQRAEHRYAGVPCGIMDQFISVMGREGHALLIDCRSQEPTLVPMPPPARAVLVVIDTCVRHALASGEYAARRAACEAAAARLGASLRDASLEQVIAAFPSGDPLLPIARHIVTENQRTLEAADALRTGDLEWMGWLMAESHASLRDYYRVSCPELDTAVAAASRVPGVFGARMTGGGFGGCAIALVKPEAVGALTDHVRGRYAAAHGRECRVFATRVSAGAAALPL